MKLSLLTRVAGSVALHAASSGSSAVLRTMEAIDDGPPYIVDGLLASVIIPALQEEDYIEPLLASVRNQTYRPMEIVIVDSSPPESKEATRQIASLYDTLMVSEPKGSISGARNAGAKASRGGVLVFCDADCIMEHSFIEKLVDKLEEGAILSHGNDCVYDSWFHNTMHSFWRVGKPRLYTSGRGVAIRREDFFAVGGYDEACNPMENCREDLDLGRRIEEHFGPGAVVIDRSAMVATCARRPLGEPGVWEHRGYRRGGQVIDRRRYVRAY